VYYPSMMLMVLAEERAGDFNRRDARAGLRSLNPGRARLWPTAAFAALTGRSRAAGHKSGG
jgi:hypothetical protein